MRHSALYMIACFEDCQHAVNSRFGFKSDASATMSADRLHTAVHVHVQ